MQEEIYSMYEDENERKDLLRFTAAFGMSAALWAGIITLWILLK